MQYNDDHHIANFKGSCKCHLSLSDLLNTLFILFTYRCLFLFSVETDDDDDDDDDDDYSSQDTKPNTTKYA